MGTMVSNIYDEIKLHGSWEAYVEFRDIDLKKVEPLPNQEDIPYFPDPEVVDKSILYTYDPSKSNAKGIVAMIHEELLKNLKI